MGIRVLHVKKPRPDQLNESNSWYEEWLKYTKYRWDNFQTEMNANLLEKKDEKKKSE